MLKFKTAKLLGISVLSVFVTQVAAQQGKSNNWIDFSDPTAIYSKAGLGAGSEGVDLYGAFGGYLGGQFKHKLTVEAMHDLDYYNINYFAFNTSNDTGFSLDTRWGDVYDQASIGVLKKLPLENKSIKIYPSMHLGLMWSDTDDSTTYIEINAAARYSVNRVFWFGVTPSYIYAMRGMDINELNATVDVGYQLAKDIAVSGHFNNDGEAWADFTFAF
ncbi:hypothetical protein [Psychromonas antarctica]|jgi:hypothetical protein|uniref:hypothetical protein n=1 Tax=Psychromonas antarctica TaxID=67573 RepID=UPI001EE8CDD3|nr:hypothetical protein [Psychromonas antarctica]MCG6202561.1 hypothetical protein [Psychromonas antarctica]